MQSITERQKEILMAIIREFMKNADEVGSLALLEKYDLAKQYTKLQQIQMPECN